MSWGRPPSSPRQSAAYLGRPLAAGHQSGPREGTRRTRTNTHTHSALPHQYLSTALHGPRPLPAARRQTFGHPERCPAGGLCLLASGLCWSLVSGSHPLTVTRWQQRTLFFASGTTTRPPPTYLTSGHARALVRVGHEPRLVLPRVGVSSAWPARQWESLSESGRVWAPLLSSVRGAGCGRRL